jgi:hypothetical protein
MSDAAARIGSRRLRIPATFPGMRFAVRWWRWAAVPFGVLYLILLAAQFGRIVASTYLNADTASAPVIGQLLGSAPGHASVVLGQLGWYSTLLFELGTKWLPAHREVWEAAPYAMALASTVLITWAVSRVAGRWAAGLSAVLIVCASPGTLQLLFALDDHAPTWFTLSLLGAFLVLLERNGPHLRMTVVAPLTIIVGVIAGANGASDPLVAIGGLAPFLLAAFATYYLVRSPLSFRAMVVALSTVGLTAVSWIVTHRVADGLHAVPCGCFPSNALASGSQVGHNVSLWLQSIAVLGNGDFFSRQVSFTSGLALACAALTLGAVMLLPRIAWLELPVGRPLQVPRQPARLAWVVFWCASATLLTAAFVLSAAPVAVASDRYLVGLIYAAAAVIPMIAAGRLATEVVAVIGSCIFALAGVVSLAQGTAAKIAAFPSDATISEVARVAEQNHLTVGYAGYWDAAPITWATRTRVRVYPVLTCGDNGHVCRFFLHYISSWYTPRPSVHTFLLTDRTPPLAFLPAPTPDLGPPSAVYHINELTMYVYPYDLATKILP